MHFVLIVLLILLLPSCAPKNWTTRDTVWEAAAEVLLWWDWEQTQWITKNPDYQGSECNPVLGSNPDIGLVDKYFIGHMVAHPVISCLLPPQAKLDLTWMGLEEYNVPWRRIWQVSYVVVETGCIGNNILVGVKADWF